jgi:hypothetical protein
VLTFEWLNQGTPRHVGRGRNGYKIFRGAAVVESYRYGGISQIIKHRKLNIFKEKTTCRLHRMTPQNRFQGGSGQ